MSVHQRGEAVSGGGYPAAVSSFPRVNLGGHGTARAPDVSTFLPTLFPSLLVLVQFPRWIGTAQHLDGPSQLPPSLSLNKP